jgi:iron complex transport system ATP-binding protein
VEVAVTLAGEGLGVGYGSRRILHGVDVEIEPGSFTVIIGPNACGKSTLLRALARSLKPSAGTVLLDGEDVSRLAPKAFARRLGMLPQTSTAPDGITVHELVGRGRFPHQSALRQWSREDETAVQAAMEATGVAALRDRYVDELSGGQRQRVWIALVLAQQTPTLLLDEPTTYLDVSHQYEVLDLCERLRADGRTLVAVLHDLNQAARYATHLIAMRAGEVVATGRPRDVVTEQVMADVFNLSCQVIDDPETGAPMVVPRRRARLRDEHADQPA